MMSISVLRYDRLKAYIPTNHFHCEAGAACDTPAIDYHEKIGKILTDDRDFPFRIQTNIRNFVT